MDQIKSLKGFKDLLPEESQRWESVQEVMRKTFHAFGFSSIQTPILERTALFTRSIGKTTDIVEKEMYTFEDWDGKPVTLRPEGTASVVRAALEQGLIQPPLPSKLYYQGPMFRHERPQAGRLRQFHQIGAEIIGEIDPRVDVELLSLLSLFFQKLGIGWLTLEINSLGCPVCRPSYRKALKSYFGEGIADLCEDCKRRYQTNPLRILDCKNTRCRAIIQHAPVSVDHLCTECETHFEAVQDGLALLKIPCEHRPHLVRGLDYYTKTAFEMTTTQLGAQNAVAAGGRYDGLVEALGGPATPAIGFAIGMERLVQLYGRSPEVRPALQLFLAPLGEAAGRYLFFQLFEFRKRHIRSEIGKPASALKRQMKQADRLGAAYVLIVGDRELASKKAVLRDMKTKEQCELALENPVDAFADQLSRKNPR
ncbi:MAG: histidine--tRNA ligase [Nitrospiria bacterium]